MKIPLSWISLFCPVSSILQKYGAKGLAHEYSIRTAEIEGIETFDFDSRVIVAKVLSTAKHPDSDHLNLVRISTGTAEKGIVCGAANVVGAKYVALATEGAILPGNFTIKKTVIRGQESDGMICSLDELGLQEERSEGIFRLEDEYGEDFLASFVGRPFSDLPLEIPGVSGGRFEAKLNDTVFEIDNKFITNRPDLFSVEGNAREFGALFGSPFSPYRPKNAYPTEGLEVSIESDRVLAYRLVRVENVAAAPSPLAVRVLLARSGINAKYDLVDMTNFVMTELGQPMHAFDADTVEGRVCVRLAKEGESILALDAKEYRLTKEDLVIADEKKVLAVAGVIGGASSAVSDSTKNVLIESATFDPVSVRLTAQRIGCRTDASTRFEKSIDPVLTDRAMARSLEFLAFLKKNPTASAGFAYLNETCLKTADISFPLSFVERKLGIVVPSEEIVKILTALGFTASVSNGTVNAKAPTWRVTKDVSIKEDIVEEIGRVYGYDRIAEAPFTAPYSISEKNSEIAFRNLIADAFVSAGYLEAYTYSFSNEEKDRSVGFSDMSNAIAVVNAVSTEYTHMRRSPAPLLISAASENLKRSNAFSFFEYGKVHVKKGGSFEENRSLAGISVSGAASISRGSAIQIRDDVTAFLQKACPTGKISVGQGIDLEHFPFLHPGKSGTLALNGKTVAAFGSLNPKTASIYSLEEAECAYFEVDVAALLSEYLAHSEPAFAEPSKYPGVTRELNFVMEERSLSGDAATKIASFDPRVRSVRLVDVFRDDSKVGEGKKSVTFSLTIEDGEKTITDAEVLEIQTRIVDGMKNDGYLLRTS